VSLVLTLLGVIIYRYWAYELALHRIERAGAQLHEAARQLQSPSIPKQYPSIEKPVTEAERQETRKKKAFEKAFDAYYTPPKECERWKSDKHMVECVNHRIRTKRAFQKKYDADFEMAERSGDNWVQ